jgi:cation diffusion facilitator family transporter
MTLYAVMKADVAPDSGHLYGHGKLENLSSLVETFLLFVTAIWIVYEALERLFVPSPVDVSIWAILVMIISAAVNYSRSKVMYTAARKYKSQALEADAVHFKADLITSLVVIAGIIPVALGYAGSLPDTLAAIVVAAIIVPIGFRIGKKSVDALMDAAPPGLVKLISEEAKTVEGIEKIGRIRVRESGSKTFIDINVSIDKVLPLEVAHSVTETLTSRIQSVIPDSDVMVHAEPHAVQSKNLVVRIRQESADMPEIKNIHSIHVYEIDKKLCVDFHIEVDGNLPLAKAHEISNKLEERVTRLDPAISSVSSHVEPLDEGIMNGEVDNVSYGIVKETIEEVVKGYPEIKCFKKLNVRKVAEKLTVTLECHFNNEITVNDAHRIADQLEDSIRARINGIDSVYIHLEPENP